MSTLFFKSHAPAAPSLPTRHRCSPTTVSPRMEKVTYREFGRIEPLFQSQVNEVRASHALVLMSWSEESRRSPAEGDGETSLRLGNTSILGLLRCFFYRRRIVFFTFWNDSSHVFHKVAQLGRNWGATEVLQGLKGYCHILPAILSIGVLRLSRICQCLM